MDSRKLILKQTLLVLVGQAICIGVMLGIFALLGSFDQKVLLGGIFGGIIATGNFFFMAVAVAMASDKAVNQDVRGGQATIKLSYFLRMAVIAVILFALVKSGLCNVLTAVLPLVFTRPILSITAFFQKGDDLP